VELRKRVWVLEQDLEESERKVIELHHAPSPPQALIEAVLNAERFVGYLSLARNLGVDVGDAKKHALAASKALQAKLGWSP